MNFFFDFLSAVLLVGFVQNLVITGGYGSSEALRMAAKPKGLAVLCGFISFFSVTISIICSLLEKIPEIAKLDTFMHFLIYTGVLALVYLLVCTVVLLLKADKRIINRLGVGALNTLVLAVPLINFKSGFSVYEAVGSGLGAGLAFGASVVMINAGIKKLRQNEDIPPAFSGAPALFIYTALLALGLAALSGRFVSV